MIVWLANMLTFLFKSDDAEFGVWLNQTIIDPFQWDYLTASGSMTANRDLERLDWKIGLLKLSPAVS